MHSPLRMERYYPTTDSRIAIQSTEPGAVTDA